MSLLDEARAARDAAHKEQGLLLDAAAGAKRSFTDCRRKQVPGTKHKEVTA